MKFRKFLSFLKRNMQYTPIWLLDNPFLILTLNTGSLQDGGGPETCCPPVRA